MTHEITQQITHKLLRMAVLASETCWALNNEIIKQVTWSWYLFTQLSLYLLTYSLLVNCKISCRFMQLQFISCINITNCKVKCINFQVMWQNFIKDSMYCKGNANISHDWNSGLQEVLNSVPVIILIFCCNWNSFIPTSQNTTEGQPVIHSKNILNVLTL